MKKVFGILIFMSLFFVNGCEMTKQQMEDVEPQLSFDENKCYDFAVPADGGKVSFPFEANGDWSVNVEGDWIKVEPANGSGSATIDVMAESNKTDDGRYGGVTVKMGKLRQNIKVYQPKPELAFDFKKGTDRSPLVPWEGGTLSVEFETDSEWKVEADEDWATVSPSSGKGSSKVEVKIAANKTLGPRTQYIRLSINPKFSKVICITQYSEVPVPVDVIYYTSSDNKKVYPHNALVAGPEYDETERFGAKLISNTFSPITGIGVLQFEGLVTRVGEDAFKGCKTLTSVLLPNSVTYIGDSAFNETALTSIVIPHGVTEIGDAAFSETKLRSISLPDTITEIPGAMFNESNLRGIVIPESVTSIGHYAFYQCVLSCVDLPESVFSIGSAAFFSSGLSRINITSSMTEIGYQSFAATSLERVFIPKNIKKIDELAFYGSSDLDCVVFESTTPPEILRDAFFKCDRNILVPAESVDLYKSIPNAERLDIKGYYGAF